LKDTAPGGGAAGGDVQVLHGHGAAGDFEHARLGAAADGDPARRPRDRHRDGVAQDELSIGRVQRDGLCCGKQRRAQIGENFTLALGAAFPLKWGTDRSFDYQLGIRANWFFGPTARARSRATAVQGF
jgi:hypothetical protein